MAADNARDRPVARLLLHRIEDAHHAALPIPANAEFDVGRDQVRNALRIDDGTISKHHLKFHCVTYEDDNLARVPPMVYVRVLSRHGARFSAADSEGGSSTRLLRGEEPSILLNHGDSLQISGKVIVVFHALTQDIDEQIGLGDTVVAEAKLFDKQYTVTPRMLGAGGFAKVLLAMNVKSGRQVACKIVRIPKKPPLPNSDEWDALPNQETLEQEAAAYVAYHRKKCQDLRREFEILKGIDHPNIIRLEKAIYADSRIYIFQELLSGGDLLSYLERKGGLDEPETMVIIHQVLKAVDYLHRRGIVHRDIKPENIMLTSWRKGARIVLTDFGQSRKINEDETVSKSTRAVSRMHSVVGTRGYAAPEVYLRTDDSDITHKSGYNEAVDVWSIGCLAGTLITNAFLFPSDRSQHSQNSTDEHANISPEPFELDFLDSSPEWQAVSRKCKSFVKGCVQLDESQRMTVEQALQHSWIAHPGYAAAMEAEYARAIADWRPRTNSQNLIENVKTPLPEVSPIKSGYDAQLHNEVRSHHFQSQMLTSPSQFRSFDSLPHVGGQNPQSRLPPIGKTNHMPAATMTSSIADVGLAASGDLRSSFSLRDSTTPRLADETASYLSIQDYAPPKALQALGFSETSLAEPDEWSQRIANSIFPERLATTGSPAFPHRRMRA